MNYTTKIIPFIYLKFNTNMYDKISEDLKSTVD